MREDVELQSATEREEQQCRRPLAITECAGDARLPQERSSEPESRLLCLDQRARVSVYRRAISAPGREYPEHTCAIPAIRMATIHRVINGRRLRVVTGEVVGPS